MAHPVFVQLRQAARAVSEIGLALLFPPSCVHCGRMGEHFCDACAQAVQATPHPHCARCGRHLPVATTRCPTCARHAEPSLLLVRAAALHTAPLRQAIHAFKYEAQPTLAPLLARYLVAVYALPPWSTLPYPITAVVPVPLHEQRQAARGYNQSELLADYFCKTVGLPLQPTWLTRIRETRQQVGLGPSERHANVADAFVATAAVAGHCLLLIDDVYTTGATLRACARAAHAAGAHAVYGLTLAQPAARPSAFAPELSGNAPGYEEGHAPEEPWWESEL